jgi:NAD+ kinase
MNTPFNSVTLLARVFNEGIIETLHALVNCLELNNTSIFIESTTSAAIKNTRHPEIEKDFLGKDSDLIIVVGGDGSLLHAARGALKYDTPVIGVSRGNLGFLTDILPATLETQLKQVLEGNYQEEHRFLLDLNLGEETPHHALNEVALITHKSPQLLEFEIQIGGQLVCSQRSDGVIISTPTGSTAYSLSAGGPILHPELNAITIVPMLPHTLSMRPIVVSGDSQITLKLSASNERHAMICCDGQEPIEVHKEQPLLINKNKQALRLIHPINYDYFEALRSKLHWASKPKQG